MQPYLRNFWKSILNFNWKFGLFLVLIICVPRFIMVLHANQYADYRFIGLIMLVSFIIPFVFLNKRGLKAIGWNKPKSYKWLSIAFISGCLYAYLLFVLGKFLYQDSYQNWYVYIANSYKIPTDLTIEAKRQMFFIMAGTGMLFSPFGEELFFRGIVHETFVSRFGNRGAFWINIPARRLASSLHTYIHMVFFDVFCKQTVLFLQGKIRSYMGRYNLPCSL